MLPLTSTWPPRGRRQAAKKEIIAATDPGVLQRCATCPGISCSAARAPDAFSLADMPSKRCATGYFKVRVDPWKHSLRRLISYGNHSFCAGGAPCTKSPVLFSHVVRLTPGGIFFRQPATPLPCYRHSDIAGLPSGSRGHRRRSGRSRWLRPSRGTGPWRAGATHRGFANLAIGHGLAHADVHPGLPVSLIK